MTDHHISPSTHHTAGSPFDRPSSGMGPPASEGPAVLDRRYGPYGEVVLRRHGDLLQIIANGSFLMDTSDGRSERRLVRDALEAVLRPPTADTDERPADSPEQGTEAGTETGATDGPGAGPGERPWARDAAPAVLIGGLGVGFSLAEAAADPRWGSITVVEREPAVLDWHHDGAPLAPLTAAARADPRTALVQEDLREYIRNSSFRFDVICLDVDNGPEWTVTEENDDLYTATGLAALHARLTPGGILGVWSARPSATFGTALYDAGFREVRSAQVPVRRGEPDVIHLARRMP